jgi:hypothetical protein
MHYWEHWELLLAAAGDAAVAHVAGHLAENLPAGGCAHQAPAQLHVRASLLLQRDCCRGSAEQRLCEGMQHLPPDLAVAVMTWTQILI